MNGPTILLLTLAATTLLASLPVPARAACEVVRFDTSDGVSLEADWCPAPDLGAPLLVLMHMIPPHHSRANFSAAVRGQWVDAGFSVINVDRRGAGASAGNAKEAYKGPKGKIDVQAALRFAASRGANTKQWGCVGASNGTTSCLDAATAAPTEATPGPSALVFMTGGTYTEAQTALSGSSVKSVPTLFTFNEKEKEWSESHRKGSDKWEFKTYSPGGHGTLVFGANPESAVDIANFLKATLK